ncbi:MAG: hypothetical protein JWR83_2529 [Aeromicrobium sp.]|nr:hypothetical protein [Aeromicrobium sp.]
MTIKPEQNRRSITVRLPSLTGLRARLPRWSLTRLGRGRWLAALVALIVVVAVADVFLYRDAHHQSAVANARADAVTSAKTRLPAMLSYKYTSLDGDLAIASGNATGSFRTQYATLLREVVAPNALKKKISTSATVTGSSVVSGDNKQVVVLLFVTQRTTTGKAKPVLTGSRIEVQMTKTDKGWFVSKITPV